MEENDNISDHKEAEDLTPEEKDKIVDKHFEKLIENTPRLKKEKSLEKVKAAYDYAKKAHQGQMRKGGQKLPYISHPIAVATIVAQEMGFGSTTIAAALLHDVVEDTKVTIQNIRDNFGDEIALIVDGLTKITNVPNANRTEQAATFQNLILKMSQDKRVAFVKIADRLHNLRTMNDMRINSINIKTAEALAVYAPLAFKLGLVSIRNEIENICFRLREPVEYERIEKIVKQNSRQLQEVTGIVCEKLYESIHQSGIEYNVLPVRRSLYRLRNEMQDKRLNFSQISNFQSERIVFKPLPDVDIKEQCFKVYCIVSSIFRVRPDSLRDWVSNKRSNGFQALVFDVLYDEFWKEIQIMTQAMHEIAQTGYAKNHDNTHILNVNDWVNATEQTIQNQDLSNDELISLLYGDSAEIHIVTPKGDLVSLPKKSTVLDFAFKIHTDLGLSFLSAEVNREIVNKDYVLRNGDYVNIISSQKVKPTREWFDYLTGAGNRAKLSEYFSRMESDHVQEGKAIFDELRKNVDLDEKHIFKLTDYFEARDLDDLYYKIGKGYVLKKDMEDAIRYKSGFWGILPNLRSKNKSGKESKIIIPNPKEPLIIRSLDEISLATCCRPIPGDSATLYIESEHELIIHKRDCQTAKKLSAADGKKTRAVIWQLTQEEIVPAKIRFSGKDRLGLLSDMLRIIHDELSVNMKNLNIEAEGQIFKGVIEFWITDLDILQTIIDNIKSLKGISQVSRA